MYVSLQFQDKADQATANSLFDSAAPNVRTLFHHKAGEGYRLSAKVDYKTYEDLVCVVSGINEQLPYNIQPFEVIAVQEQQQKKSAFDFRF